MNSGLVIILIAIIALVLAMTSLKKERYLTVSPPPSECQVLCQSVEEYACGGSESQCDTSMENCEKICTAYAGLNQPPACYLDLSACIAANPDCDAACRENCYEQICVNYAAFQETPSYKQCESSCHGWNAQCVDKNQGVCLNSSVCTSLLNVCGDETCSSSVKNLALQPQPSASGCGPR